MAYSRIFEMTRHNVVKDHLNYFRRDLTDMLSLDKFVNFWAEMWLPVQEVRANVHLMAVKENMETEGRKKCDELIKANNIGSKVVRDLTKLSEHILFELGFKNGPKLLDELSIIASSPGELLNIKIPRSFEDLRKSKIDRYEKGRKLGVKNPEILEPTLRFMYMIKVTIDKIGKIKSALSKEAPLSGIANDIRIFCGLKTETLQTYIEKLLAFSSSVANNERMSKDRREFNRLQIRVLNMLTDMIRQKQPTFWFVNDIETNKIIFGRSDVANKYKELDTFMHGNVMKYQFVNSFVYEKDFFSCFDKRLTVCESDCDSCYINKGVKIARNLYETTIKFFSYDDLKREAFDEERFKSAILQ